jgi:hypothetical protein
MGIFVTKPPQRRVLARRWIHEALARLAEASTLPRASPWLAGAGRRATVREVLSYGALDAGKTEGATGPSRRPPIDALLADDLTAWKAALGAHGYPTASDDFLPAR